MKLFLLAVFLVSASAVQLRRKPEWDSDWENFKGRHGKKYSVVEEGLRRTHWEEDRDKVEKHNAEFLAGKQSYSMALNHMSDWTPSEKKQLLAARQPSLSEAAVSDLSHLNRQSLSASVDYTNTTCLTPVRNQQTCGSCWAFSATTVLEFQLCKKAGSVKQISLSEQQLVDCSRAYDNYGCNGGWYVNAWKYVQAATGQTNAATYPYTNSNGTCKYQNSTSAGATTGYKYVTSKNATAIQLALANVGPVSTALDVQNSFFSYSTGVYDGTDCSTDGSSVNHAVVMVGYGTSGSTPYWIIRNSWGTTWGQKGYALVKRGTNKCNIESWVAYPTV